MDDASATPDPTVLDIAYLDDMRGWVGDDVLAELLGSALASLVTLVAAVGEAWDRGDLNAVREAGHRLKGGAGSVACRRLSDLGQSIQFVPGLDDPTLRHALAPAEAEALTALGAYHAGLGAPA